MYYITYYQFVARKAVLIGDCTAVANQQLEWGKCLNSVVYVIDPTFLVLGLSPEEAKAFLFLAEARAPGRGGNSTPNELVCWRLKIN